jgi:hypothetical protein
MLKGDYYFLTFTTSPKELRSIEHRWLNLRHWLRRYVCSAMEWVYCITNEGNGVIHMVYRLPERTTPISKEDIAKQWGSFVTIYPVKNKKGLANYMSDQRRRGMALEMYSQETIIRYRMSKNWVPRQFMVYFGRFYQKFSDLDDTTMNELLRDWVVECEKNIETVKYPPHKKGNTIRWCNSYDEQKGIR